MRIASLAVLIGLLIAPAANAQRAARTEPLWMKDAPGIDGDRYDQLIHRYQGQLEAAVARGLDDPTALMAPSDQAGDLRDIPTITAFLPPRGKATGASVVVCPGGGYGFLAMTHEGKQVAEWLNSIGVAAFVLKYRLGPKYHHPVMLEDAQRALRLVRSRAEQWNLDPKRVGILGFSAGGHLASTAATHFDLGKADARDPIDHQSCRPDFAILVYPVVALATPFGHTGSLKNLLGDDPPQDLVDLLSNEKQVTKDTPPTFLAHTNEDKGVAAENSILFVLALRKAGVPVEFHLFEKGQHGLGLGNGSEAFHIAADPAFQAWPGLCKTWMDGRSLLKHHDDKPATP